MGFEVPIRNVNGKKFINMEQSRRKRYIYICIPIINKCTIHILNFKSIIRLNASLIVAFLFGYILAVASGLRVGAKIA